MSGGAAGQGSAAVTFPLRWELNAKFGATRARGRLPDMKIYISYVSGACTGFVVATIIWFAVFWVLFLM
jgi:hypothetical protein